VNIMWKLCIAASFVVVFSKVKARRIKSLPHYDLPDGTFPDGTRIKTSYQCSGSSLHLSCPQDLTIQLMRSNYGRFSIAICNHQGVTTWNVHCKDEDSIHILGKMCNGLSSCMVDVNSITFPVDPCPLPSTWRSTSSAATTPRCTRASTDPPTYGSIVMWRKSGNKTTTK